MKTILVIEDEPHVRENIQEIFELEGFRVLSEETGLSGLQRAREAIPDLIVCDIMLPMLDGYKVVAMLREYEPTAAIPVILLTAKAERADLRQGMELGANDYITKPFTPAELLDATKAQFNRQSATERQAEKKLNHLRVSLAQALPHELRTPLNAIIGFSDLLLLDEMALPPNARELLRDINGAGKTLHRLVERCLLYAELELIALDETRRQQLHNSQSASWVTVLVTHTSQRIAAQVQRSQDLQLNLQEATVAIQEVWLKNLVEEVVDNAFKFSAPGSAVQIETSSADGQFHLTVRDRGCGMDASQLKQLGAWTQFERKLREQSGIGMGLALVQRLLQLHDGRLEIESHPEEGTVVHLWLPLVPEGPASEADWFNSIAPLGDPATESGASTGLPQ